MAKQGRRRQDSSLPIRARHASDPALVRQLGAELRRRPNIPLGVLQAFAAHLDPTVSGMEPRRFHAAYIVPAQQLLREDTSGERRRAARATPATESPPVVPPPPPSSPGAEPPESIARPSRTQIRAALLDFARDLADSDERAHWVRILTQLDEYVDRALA